jgi:hypothetical protein
VFGDPYYGKGSRFYNLFMEGYGCGDQTVDLTGCPKCPNEVKNDMLSYLHDQPSDSKVIFISCVLEYIDPIQELRRVCGSIDNIFIVTVKRFSLSTYFYQEDSYWALNIIKGPPKYNDIMFTPSDFFLKFIINNNFITIFNFKPFA